MLAAHLHCYCGQWAWTPYQSSTRRRFSDIMAVLRSSARSTDRSKNASLQHAGRTQGFRTRKHDSTRTERPEQLSTPPPAERPTIQCNTNKDEGSVRSGSFVLRSIDRATCRHCGQDGILKRIKSDNKTGNVGRHRWICLSCKAGSFHHTICFNDHLGVRDTNPLCYCHRPSRQNSSRCFRCKKGRTIEDGHQCAITGDVFGYWNCVNGQCGYLSFRHDGGHCPGEAFRPAIIEADRATLRLHLQTTALCPSERASKEWIQHIHDEESPSKPPAPLTDCLVLRSRAILRGMQPLFGSRKPSRTARTNCA